MFNRLKPEPRARARVCGEGVSINFNLCVYEGLDGGGGGGGGVWYSLFIKNLARYSSH